jgi:hypothetical protein
MFKARLDENEGIMICQFEEDGQITLQASYDFSLKADVNRFASDIAEHIGSRPDR